MKLVQLNYNQFKSIVESKNLVLQYVEHVDRYELFAIEGSLSWETTILKGSNDATDFETNYKDTANQPLSVRIKSSYINNKPVVRSESRPDDTSSYFTTRGDSATGIGDGSRFEWDFSNSDNEVSAPSGYKRKRIETSFADDVWVKEGTVYFYNTPKGAYIDFYVVCPDGQYYYDRNGDPQQAVGDVIIEHYVVAHPMQDSAPMGDELNTEAATINAVPPSYKFRIEITTPESDSGSNGYAELELYRIRSILRPGEEI